MGTEVVNARKRQQILSEVFANGKDQPVMIYKEFHEKYPENIYYKAYLPTNHGALMLDTGGIRFLSKSFFSRKMKTGHGDSELKKISLNDYVNNLQRFELWKNRHFERTLILSTKCLY